MRSVEVINVTRQFRPESYVPTALKANAQRLKRVVDPTVSEPYFVPFQPMTHEQAQHHGITDNFYGGIFEHPAHFDKAMLHPLVRDDATAPPWYSTEFARAVENETLAGFTVFTFDDALTALHTLESQGSRVRLKDPSRTGGNGQWLIENSEQLMGLLSDLRFQLESGGLVLEADLNDCRDITIGYVDLEGDRYSWIGQAYPDKEFNGEMRSIGGAVTVVRGDVEAVGRNVEGLSAIERSAVGKVALVLAQYPRIGGKVYRASFDVAYSAQDGTIGVVDPSFRNSASTPAEIAAIEALQSNHKTQAVRAETRRDYSGALAIDGSDGELHVHHPNVTILTRVLETMQN